MGSFATLLLLAILPLALSAPPGTSQQLTASQNITTKWPRGTYSLPMVDNEIACPSSSGVYWQIGYRIQDTETLIVPLIGGNVWSSPCHLRGPYGKLYTQLNFCNKKDTSFDPDYDWPAGEYCVLRNGGSCPTGRLLEHCIRSKLTIVRFFHYR